jgi:hypothetical protein
MLFAICWDSKEHAFKDIWMFEERCEVNISNPLGDEIMVKHTEEEVMLLSACSGLQEKVTENRKTSMTWLEDDSQAKMPTNTLMFFVPSPGHEAHGAQ